MVDSISVKDSAGASQTVPTLAPLIAANHTDLAAILAKILAAPATEAKQDTGNTALASILAKVIAAPSTEAKQDAANVLLSAIGTLLTTQAGYLDGVETALGLLGTQTTLAAVLAKLSADPATQTSLAAFLAANHTDLAAILAKLPTNAAPMQQTGGSVGPVPLVSATRSDVAVAVTGATVVLAANTNRKPGSVIACDTTAISYFKFATGASASDFIAAVDGKTTVPGIFNVPDGYLGAIYGYGASATGTWRVTEMA